MLEIAAGGLAVLALAYTLWLLIRNAKLLGRWLVRAARPGAHRWNDTFPLLLLVCLAVFFWRSSATADQPLYVPIDGAGRYALPATTALDLMRSRGIVDLGGWLRRVIGRANSVPSRAWIKLYGVLLALIMLLYALPSTMFDMVNVMQSPYNCRSTFPVTDTETLTYLKQHNIHYVWTAHWYGNVIMYLTDGNVLCADYHDIVVKHGVSRFPHTFELISRVDRPSFIVTSASSQTQPSLLHALDALHVTYTSALPLDLDHHAYLANSAACRDSRHPRVVLRGTSSVAAVPNLSLRRCTDATQTVGRVRLCRTRPTVCVRVLPLPR